MLIQIPNRSNLLTMLMAIGFIESKGYQISLNESGFICPVLSDDTTMNVVFKSNALYSDEVNGILKLSIPDISSFKKFFKNIPNHDAIIDYDEHLNSITYGDTKLSLNGKDVVPGRTKSKLVIEGEWYRAELKDVNPFHEMCLHKSIGNKVEINNRKVQLYNWDMRINVIDMKKNPVVDEFKIFLDRDIMKTITHIHKKIGEGSMYITIYKDPDVPLVKIQGDGINYVAYCGLYNEG